QPNPVAGQRLAVGGDLDLRHLSALDDSQVGDAGHAGDQGLRLLRIRLEGHQVGTVDLHRNLAELTADVLVDVVADGLAEVRFPPGDRREVLPEIGDDV